MGGTSIAQHLRASSHAHRSAVNRSRDVRTVTVLDVAVLGAGDRARGQLATISLLVSLWRLVGICGSGAARAAEIGRESSVPAYVDLDWMLVETRPKLLYVVTPPNTHHAVVELAGRHGVHVISETPIASTLPLGGAMIASAKRHGIKLEIAENVWCWPGERLKHLTIEAGLIGEVTEVHFWYYSGSYHGVSAARTLIGREPVRAPGYARDTPVPLHGDRVGRFLASGLYEHGSVEFEGGAICVYQFPLYPHDRSRWDVIGTRAAIVGGDLIIMRDGERQVFPIRRKVDNSSDQPAFVPVHVETDLPAVWENPYRADRVGVEADDIGRADILARMLRAIVEDTDPQYGAAFSRKDQQVVIALRGSVRRDGDWVNFPLTEPSEGECQLHEDYARRHGHGLLEDVEEVLRIRRLASAPAELALLEHRVKESESLPEQPERPQMKGTL